jgi:hypothetical protein
MKKNFLEGTKMELDTKAAAVGAVFYIICLIGIWVVKVGDGLDMGFKVALTIGMLPLCYLMAYWQINK